MEILLNSKVKQAHENIDGVLVAMAIINFQSEFRDVYPRRVLACELTAVGPLQSLIGHAIEKGILRVGEAYELGSQGSSLPLLSQDQVQGSGDQSYRSRLIRWLNAFPRLSRSNT